MKWAHWLLLASMVLLVDRVSAQVPPEKAVGTFRVSDPALEISLWASEPLFCNPTCMDIDEKGRVWVCESVNYRHTLHHLPPKEPKGDRIVILEDTQGTGKADKAITFYQSPEVLAPLGIAVAKDPVGPGYKVFLCQSPDILVFEDKDGDGKADGPPRKLLTGFGGFDIDHGVHGILIGPDNKLYFSIGDAGVHGLQGRDGGRKWSNNNTDLQAGSIWRCNLDGTHLELVAHNFRNEYEPCVDSFGTVFVSDNDDDGNQQTRICYVMPGGNYGYHPRGPKESHWHEEQPGVVPKILRTYFGAPTGLCVYEGTLLAPSYREQLLHTDAGPRQLRCYHLTPEGAGYAVNRQDLVDSTDTWFRPSDVCVAPDGSVYIADWYDPGVGGHGIADFTRGRIFRVAPHGNRPSVPKVDLDSKEGLTAALASPALSVRYLATAKLQSMEVSKALAILEPAAQQKEIPWLRARALWQLGRLQADAKEVAQAFQDPDPRFRVEALRIEKDCYGRSPADLSPSWQGAILKDPSAAVRREALLLLREVEPAKAKPLILGLAIRYEGQDRFYLEAIGIAVGLEPARRELILADFDKQFPGWNDRTADLIWELRPPQVLPLLEKWLTDKATSPDQRNRIVEILAVANEGNAWKSLLQALGTDQPPEVRENIIAKLKLNLPGKWQNLRQAPELTATMDRLLAQPNTRATGLALIAAAQRNDQMGKVLAIARDGRETPALRLTATQTLGVLTSGEAVQELENFLKAEKQDLPVRQAAAVALAGSHQGSVWLLELQAKKLLPEGVKPDVASLLRNSPYQDVRQRATAAFPPAGKLDPKRLPSPATLALRKGHADRGKRVMVNNKDLRCLTCHTVNGEGGHVGPDLSVIGKKASRENLFESILFPSKAIADQFQNWTLETKDGLVLTGIIEEETPDHIILRDANSKDTRINKSDIEERTKSPNSLMPADLAAYMTEDELVDIVEYLATLQGP